MDAGTVANDEVTKSGRTASRCNYCIHWEYAFSGENHGLHNV